MVQIRWSQELSPERKLPTEYHFRLTTSTTSQQGQGKEMIEDERLLFCWAEEDYVRRTMWFSRQRRLWSISTRMVFHQNTPIHWRSETKTVEDGWMDFRWFITSWGNLPFSVKRFTTAHISPGFPHTAKHSVWQVSIYWDNLKKSSGSSCLSLATIAFWVASWPILRWYQ